MMPRSVRESRILSMTCEKSRILHVNKRSSFGVIAFPNVPPRPLGSPRSRIWPFCRFPKSSTAKGSFDETGY